MKFYVVNQGGHNFKKALHNVSDDEIVYLTHGTVNIFSTIRVMEGMEKKLLDYSPTVDYIVLSGSSFLNVMAIMLATNHKEQNMKTRTVRLLIYHSKKRNYIPRDFTIDNLKGDITVI